MKYKNQNYLIIGGSRGIGWEVVQRLVKEGAQVYVACRTKHSEFDHLSIKYLPLDITQDDLSELQKFIPSSLHGVAYCPGTINLKPFSALKISDFMYDFSVNVVGAVKVLQNVLPALKKSQTGSVVFYSTVATRIGLSYHASIATAKSALEGLAKSLAAEYAGTQIRFNVIAPSLTNTTLAGNLLSTAEKQLAAAERHPLKRFGQPADIAELTVFLLTPSSNWITGQIIAVDGGLSAARLF